MDRRTVRTKRAICDAFLSLLKEKSINKITVAELSRKADLGRGTFYLHYKDVFDLYEHVENELFGELVKIFELSFPSTNPNNLMSLIEEITHFIDNNQELFLVLMRPETEGKPMRKLKTLFSEKVLLEDNTIYTSEYDKVESIFIVSGVIGVIEEWLNNGLRMTQKQVSSILHKILLKLGA